MLKALVYYCFLVFCCSGEYISLHLFYPAHCDDLFLVVCLLLLLLLCVLYEPADTVISHNGMNKVFHIVYLHCFPDRLHVAAKTAQAAAR